MFFFFFFNDTATTEIYTLSLHDALPILSQVFLGVLHVGSRRHHRQHPPIRSPEFELAVGTSFHLEAVLVHRAVVTAAQRGEVGQRRRPAAGPVPKVVALRETAAAAGEATATVSVIQRPA